MGKLRYISLSLSLSLGASAFVVPRFAHAEEGTLTDTPPSVQATAIETNAVLVPGADKPQELPKPPSPPAYEAKKRYTLPFAMRPAVAPNILRIDAAYAVQNQATVTASTVTAGGKPFKGTDLGFYARVGIVHNDVDGGKNAGAVGNPLLFALFTPEIAPKVRLGLFAGVTIPIGMGGGDVANTDAVRAGLGGAIYARQAMDNSLFATNYMTPTAGASIAWIDKGFTLQAEATAFYLVRVRGESLDQDRARTNFTSGVHAGYLIANLVNVGVEGHYQRWLSTPAVVQKDASFRDQMTVGGGVRFNVPLSDSILARPGIAYFHPVDDPMAKNGYRIVEVDVPVAF